ncbi:MAG: hypothetical protein HXS52_07150 [Theionarchaea archaeon]|nr:hypothetical protein [Theionarchaea archaeon]MBU7037693.1 hypothetical protein [Theionarchaea archaeon]
MRYAAIFLILLTAACIGQESEQPQVMATPEEIITSYVEGLNQRNLAEIEDLTHPYFVNDAEQLLDFVTNEKLRFEIAGISLVMEEEEFREMTKGLSDAEFAEQIGKRGRSYEVIVTVTTSDTSYEEILLFIELGETEEGWKVIEPNVLQLLIETSLEVAQAEG